ncbi:MAG: tyrosine-type recombinase/integrase [Selenomonadaceae bacterium]|nr:tyrosine-type recombinase/integrase [Selenomonadaceae bacterium]
MRTVSTRKRGKTWYYSFECTDGISKKRKRVEKGGFETKKEAFEEGTKALAKYFYGDISILNSKVKFGDFLQEWLRIKSTSVRPKTLLTYQAMVKAISGVLGSKNLQDIRAKHIEETMIFFNSRGYSKETLKKVIYVIKQSLDYAIYPAELIQFNPAKNIKIPKNAIEKVIERKVISKSEYEEILNQCPLGHSCHVPIVVVYHTGLRAGEVLGLTWDDVDFTNKTISVTKQIIFSGKSYFLGPPKTKTSVRVIPIDDALLDFLRQWKNLQSENYISDKGYMENFTDDENRIWSITKEAKTGQNLKLQDFVCTNLKGKLVKYPTLKDFARKHGFNFHSLRHTHATFCAENGAPLKGLAGRMGHSNISITANLYTHETEKMQKETLFAFQQGMSKNEKRRQNVGKKPKPIED